MKSYGVIIVIFLCLLFLAPAILEAKKYIRTRRYDQPSNINKYHTAVATTVARALILRLSEFTYYPYNTSTDFCILPPETYSLSHELGSLTNTICHLTHKHFIYVDQLISFRSVSGEKSKIEIPLHTQSWCVLALDGDITIYTDKSGSYTISEHALLTSCNTESIEVVGRAFALVCLNRHHVLAHSSNIK